MSRVHRFQVLPLVSQPLAARQALRASERYAKGAQLSTGFIQEYYKLLEKYYLSLSRDFAEGNVLPR